MGICAALESSVTGWRVLGLASSDAWGAAKSEEVAKKNQAIVRKLV